MVRAVAEASVRLSKDPLRVILFLLVVISISRVHQHFSVLGHLRPALLLNALAFGWILLQPGHVRLRTLLQTWPAKVIAALGVLACLSAVFGMSLGRSATFIIGDYSKTLVLAFLLLAAMRHSRDLATITWAYVVACGIMTVLAFTVFDVVKEGSSQAYRLARFYSYDANDLSLVMLIGLPLSIVMFQVSTGLRKWVSGAVLLGIGLTLARAGSRGALVALAAVAMYLLVSLRTVSVAKRVVTLTAVVAALVVGAPEGYWVQMRTILSPTEDYNWSAESGRRQVMKRGIGYMMAYPVFGVGIDNFAMAEGRISELATDDFRDRGVKWSAAHNSYVQAGSELGVIGLVLWTALVWGGFRSAIRLGRRLPRHWARGSPDERFIRALATYLPVAYVGFGVSAVFVSFAYLAPVYVLSVLLVGLHISAGVLERPSVPRPTLDAWGAGRPASRTPRR